LNELLLVVKKFLVEVGWVLKVRSFNNGVNGASLLAKTAEDALGHVDIVLSGTTRTIRTGFRLDDDGKGRASSFAQFASNASLFAGGIAAEGVLTTEEGWEDTLLPRIVNDGIGFPGSPSTEEQGRPCQLGHYQVSIHALSNICGIDLIRELITNVQADILLIIFKLRIESVGVIVFRVGCLGIQMIITLAAGLSWLSCLIVSQESKAASASKDDPCGYPSLGGELKEYFLHHLINYNIYIDYFLNHSLFLILLSRTKLSPYQR
jgi:hypothetical protein